MRGLLQSLRMAKTRGAICGLTLAAAALGACADAGDSSPSGPSTPPGPETVQVVYCNALRPRWVAFQDGDGPWVQAAAVGTGGNTAFQHDFQSNHGGIATMSGGGGGLTVLSVLYGEPAELATAGDTRPLLCGSPESRTLLGTVAGLGPSESAVVSGGLLSHTQATPARGGQFALKALPSGPHDLVVARSTPVNGSVALTGIILRRDVDLPDSTTLPVFDFTSAEAFSPATATLTLNGMGPEGASAGVLLITRNSEVRLSPVQPASFGPTRPYPAVPLSRMLSGDLQLLFASATTSGASRGARLYFRTPANRTLTLPALLSSPVFTTVATAPYLRPRARFAPQGDYDRAAGITYQQGTTTTVSVSMTAAYARTLGGYDLVIPDLSATSGFDPAWALHPGGQLLWTAGRIGGSLGLGADAVPSDGATQRTGFVTGTIPAS